MTLLGHAIAVVTASEVVSSRGLIARASVGDTRYALCILFVKRHDVVLWPGRLYGRLLM